MLARRFKVKKCRCAGWWMPNVWACYLSRCCGNQIDSSWGSLPEKQRARMNKIHNYQNDEKNPKRKTTGNGGQGEEESEKWATAMRPSTCLVSGTLCLLQILPIHDIQDHQKVPFCWGCKAFWGGNRTKKGSRQPYGKHIWNTWGTNGERRANKDRFSDLVCRHRCLAKKPHKLRQVVSAGKHPQSCFADMYTSSFAWIECLRILLGLNYVCRSPRIFHESTAPCLQIFDAGDAGFAASFSKIHLCTCAKAESQVRHCAETSAHLLPNVCQYVGSSEWHPVLSIFRHSW